MLLLDGGRAIRRSYSSASSSSSTRWKSRQAQDSYSRDARVMGLKSRAAFKLLEVRFACVLCVLGLREGEGGN